MDMIRIEGLRMETRIGVHAWEQKIDQVLLLDIEIPHNFSNIDDALEHTVDYAALCHHVTELVTSAAWKLIETVATTVAASIQDTFSVKTLMVRVSKPHAIEAANNICVEVRRG
jgi:7,8-dihydroneopterin aldolase/epimerase/oxygenase